MDIQPDNFNIWYPAGYPAKPDIRSNPKFDINSIGIVLPLILPFSSGCTLYRLHLKKCSQSVALTLMWASWLSCNTLSYGGGSSGSSMLTRISPAQYIHTTSPWLCKKGDYWIVWILNSHVHDISSTTLIPKSSTYRMTLFRTPAKFGYGEVMI